MSRYFIGAMLCMMSWNGGAETLSVFPQGTAAGKPGITAIGGIPWQQFAHTPPGKVVYGDDDRKDVYQETDAQRRNWAASTCALVDSGQLTENEEGFFTLTAYEYRIQGTPACPGEAFASQPVAAFCTGFMVGTDLIATAGHCVNEISVTETQFVFGFNMQDDGTPVLTFTPEQAYRGVEVVGRKYEDQYDFSIVRVDRPITAPSAQILEIRRTGTIATGTVIGVIGHPAGLPTKIAFGANTVVQDNTAAGYFLSNLDTFGGNSGSPVFNAETGMVEGILVTGETDYIVGQDCFRSNVLPDNAGNEGTTKSTVFAEYIPGATGQLLMDKPRYRCLDTLGVSLADTDLRGTGRAMVTVFTPEGDQEILDLNENAVLGTFYGTIALRSGPILRGNSLLEVLEGEAVIAVYEDARDVSGRPSSVTASASVDCSGPLIQNVVFERVSGHRATVAFETNESAVCTVRAGYSCGAYSVEKQQAGYTMHRVTLDGLTPETDFFAAIEASDPAGNMRVDDQSGSCYAFRTSAQVDYFTQTLFEETPHGVLENYSVCFYPDASLSGYRACASPATDYPTSRQWACPLLLGDDDYARIRLKKNKTVRFYGVEYQELYVGSNGYVTFGYGDSTADPTLMNHFALPRISGYFGDLVPGLLHPVTVQQTEDRVAITYDNVLDFWGDRHSFQIEIFFAGPIRITWLALTFPYGIAGLSAGQGIPYDYEPSVLNAYAACDAQEGEDDILPSWPGCYGGNLTPPTRPTKSGYGLLAVFAIAVLLGRASGRWIISPKGQAAG